MTLDALPLRRRARITAVHWEMLAPDEAQRLQALGLDVDAEVAIAYRGVFAGKEPIALNIGRMTVAVRRVHARAVEVVEMGGVEA